MKDPKRNFTPKEKRQDKILRDIRWNTGFIAVAICFYFVVKLIGAILTLAMFA